MYYFYLNNNHNHKHYIFHYLNKDNFEYLSIFYLQNSYNNFPCILSNGHRYHILRNLIILQYPCLHILNNNGLYKLRRNFLDISYKYHFLKFRNFLYWHNHHYYLWNNYHHRCHKYMKYSNILNNDFDFSCIFLLLHNHLLYPF